MLAPHVHADRMRMSVLMRRVAESSSLDAAETAGAAVSAEGVDSSVLGLLSADLVAIVVDFLCRIPLTTRLGTSLDALRRATARDTVAFLLASRWVAACCDATNPELRLELLARTMTSLAPTQAQVARPFLEQVLAEERSIQQLRIFKDAARSLVIHCAQCHCDAARRHLNSVVGGVSYRDAGDMPLLTARALGNSGHVRVRLVDRTANLLAVSACGGEATIVKYRCLDVSEKMYQTRIVRVSTRVPEMFEGDSEVERSTIHTEPTAIGGLSKVRLATMSQEGDLVAVAVSSTGGGHPNLVKVIDTRDSTSAPMEIAPSHARDTCKVLWFFRADGVLKLGILWATSDMVDQVEGTTWRTLMQVATPRSATAEAVRRAFPLPNLSLPHHDGRAHPVVAISPTGAGLVFRGANECFVGLLHSAVCYVETIRVRDINSVPVTAVATSPCCDLISTLMLSERNGSWVGVHTKKRCNGWTMVASVNLRHSDSLHFPKQLVASPCGRFLMTITIQRPNRCILDVVDICELLADRDACIRQLVGGWGWTRSCAVLWSTSGIWIQTTAGVLLVAA